MPAKGSDGKCSLCHLGLSKVKVRVVDSSRKREANREGGMEESLKCLKTLVPGKL